MEKIKNYKWYVAVLITGIGMLMPQWVWASQVEPIENVSLNTLVNESAHYDGKTIRVHGEVLLEALERKNYAWININDGTNAVGVTVPLSVLKEIHYYGDYKHKGDEITLIGEFHRACPDHGGDLDIHLIQLEKVVQGRAVIHPFSQIKWGLAILLSGLAGGVALFYRHATKNSFEN